MRKIRLLSVIFACMFAVTGCGSASADTTEDEQGYRVYYSNNEKTALCYEYYNCNLMDDVEWASDMLNRMSSEPANIDDMSIAKPDDVKIQKISFERRCLYIDFSKEYSDMDIVSEIIYRASVVKTLTQRDDIDYVNITIDGEALCDRNGNIIGRMSADDFVEDAGDGSSSYNTKDVVLYFANEEGDKLIRTVKTVRYSSNIQIEKLVVEQLIDGPEKGLRVNPTVSSRTDVLSVVVNDGVCYINFDEDFSEIISGVADYIPIYSVVNSICEVSDIDSVQISINGDTNVYYLESISLESPLTMNKDVVELYDPE